MGGTMGQIRVRRVEGYGGGLGWEWCVGSITGPYLAHTRWGAIRLARRYARRLARTTDWQTVEGGETP